MIIIASELYWPETTSTGKYVTRIAEGLAERDNVLVLCARPTYAARGKLVERTEVRNGVKIERLRSTALDKDRLLPRLLNALTFSLSALLSGLRRVPRASTVLVVTNPPLLPFIMAVVARLPRCPPCAPRPDQPPRAVPPTVLVRPPPGAWGEGLGASGD